MNEVILSPDEFDAVLFDMDGVVTRTAAVHFSAWKKIFDQFLQEKGGGHSKPFTMEDYLDYVDGKPREEGVKDFLRSRKIDFEQNAAIVTELAKKKDKEFLRLVHEQGVEPYETTLTLIKSLRHIGVKTALVTASRNGEEILRVTKTRQLFDATVTGVDAAKLHLAGKPAPDVFLEAARRVGADPKRAVVVEDAEAGVQSGHRGGFGLVIGVARQHNEKALKKHGADVVVHDLAEVTVPKELRSKSDIRGMSMADLNVTDANWVVSYDKYDPETEERRESLCALGNGKFCTRGASADSRSDGTHYPGTYIAGGYNDVQLEWDGSTFGREELVNMPNWLCLNFKIEEDDWFSIDKVTILQYSQKLNLREGILYREIRFADKDNRETALSERRFVHMKYSHLCGIELKLMPLNWQGKVTIRTALDGTVVNSGEPTDPRFAVRKHLQTLATDASGDTMLLKVMTNDSHLVVAQAAKTRFHLKNKAEPEERHNIIDKEYVAQEVVCDLAKSEELIVQKTCSLYTSRDKGIYEPQESAQEAVHDAPEFDRLCREQVEAWRSIWRQFDLFIETTEEHSKLVPSLLLHLNSFHTLQTASSHTVDLDSSVPARGWTGEGYQGHIFWDDLFVFPFINLRMPNISAALLKYRYRRLASARKIARKYGARGACFPWQSAGNGKERTPDYWWLEKKDVWVRDYTHLEIHVNGAIAYNLWQYYQVTGDYTFMYSYGSEMLLEIARFFATYAKFNEQRKRYEIHTVIGPDEFHNMYPKAEKPGVNNNAYTNLLATWTIGKALELLDALPADHCQHIRSRLGITKEEIVLWQQICKRMFIPIMSNGIIEQFEGYEKLSEFPGFAESHSIQADELGKELLENNGYLNQYRVSKQADVLMLGFLFSPAELGELVSQLGYPCECIDLERMADFYIPRTANQSTLSRVAHAWVLSRLERLVKKEHCKGEVKKLASSEHEATQIFYEALGSDYYDVAARGTARTGIHMGAMAGTVDIVQRCYTGIVTRDEVLWLDPMLPKPLMRLSFNIFYRDQSLSFDIHQDQMQVHAHYSTARPIKVGYHEQVYELQAGETQVIRLHKRDKVAPNKKTERTVEKQDGQQRKAS